LLAGKQNVDGRDEPPAMTIFDNPPNKKAGVVAGFSHQLLIRQN
jgi:hypothetical protein